MSLFRCQIVTIEGTVFDEEVAYLSVPAEKGMMGILPNRLPIIANLKAEGGLLKVTLADLKERYFFVKGGSLMTKRKETVVLVDCCKETQTAEEALALVEKQS